MYSEGKCKSSLCLYIFLLQVLTLATIQTKTKGYEIMTLKERAFKFIESLKLPVSVFCSHVDISRTALYRWKNGELNLKPEKEKIIDEFLKKYNF